MLAREVLAAAAHLEQNAVHVRHVRDDEPMYLDLTD
jgi:hypothetical protein